MYADVASGKGAWRGRGLSNVDRSGSGTVENGSAGARTEGMCVGRMGCEGLIGLEVRMSRGGSISFDGRRRVILGELWADMAARGVYSCKMQEGFDLCSEPSTDIETHFPLEPCISAISADSDRFSSFKS